MKKTRFLTVTLSVLLHAVIIMGFIHLAQEEKNQQHQAVMDAPVMSIALTHAIEETAPTDSDMTPMVEPEAEIVPPVVVETAQVVLPKKEKKIERPKKKVKEPNKRLSEKKEVEQQKASTNKITKSAITPQQSQQGETAASSPSMGKVGQPKNGMSNLADTQQINAYREKLRQEVERHKRYPRRAKSMKKQGVAQVQFRLTETGEITSARIVSSSGSELLDNAALAAVEKSQSVGKPPSGFAHIVTFKIEFK